MITGAEITNYLVNEYGECKHDAYAMSEAIMDMAYELEYDNEWDLFHLLVENKPIPKLYTHSYGFHTSGGRAIIESIKEKYYEKEKY